MIKINWESPLVQKRVTFITGIVWGIWMGIVLTLIVMVGI